MEGQATLNAERTHQSLRQSQRQRRAVAPTAALLSLQRPPSPVEISIPPDTGTRRDPYEKDP
jgi:hypothetical protein